MNPPVNLIGGTLPRLSTGSTARSVNRFIARRAALKNRQDAGAQHGLVRPPASPEVLYPSLSAKRSTPPARWRADVRAAAAVLALTILGRHWRGAVPLDKTLLAS